MPTVSAPSHDIDIIVIGSGAGGLAAALAMANAGQLAHLVLSVLKKLSITALL
jgi:succinate dehydrogenase/fumarate reductase flavoprotein subunit